MTRMLIQAAALLLAGEAGAQVTMPAAAARPGEVALHVVAHGEAVSRADQIELPVSVTGRGPTVAAARAAAEAAVGQVTAALVAAGIDRGAITSPALPGPRATFDPAAMAAMIGGTGPNRSPQRSESIAMTVTLNDRAGLDRARQALGTQEAARAETPRPTLRDEAPARRAAVASAIDHARREADDYAAPLGMRVARVVAVSNAAGIGDGVAELADVFNRLQDRDKTPDSVTTRATAAIDFALVAR